MALSPTEESLVRQLIAQNPALLNLASSESTIISKLGATKVSLSDLSAAASLSDADLALVRQGLNDKSFAMSVLRDYVAANLPTASTTTKGIVELATTAEAQALTDDTKALTPKKLADALDVAAFGRGQTWQDVKASRAINTTYTNSTGKPIAVNITFSGNPASSFYLLANGIEVANWGNNGTGNNIGFVGAIIPNGGTYRLNISAGTYTPGTWMELR